MIIDPMKVFVTVVEQQHFSRAAELLNLSQPGVSQHIRNLEHEFGVQLLYRSPKHVQITQAGELLYSRAKQILSLYEEAKQEINELQNVVTGTLNVGASYTIGEYILPRVLADFAKQYAFVDIQVTIANTLQIQDGVRSNKLDIGLVEGEVSPSVELQVDAFMEDEMVIVARSDHALCKERLVTPDMLQDQVWIVREPGSGTRAYWERLIQQNALRVKRSYMFSSSQGVKEAVVEGLGIAMLSRFIVQKDLLHHMGYNEIAMLPLSSRYTRQLSIVQSTKAIPSKAMDKFRDRIKSHRDS
ncbi:LysR family transcriptional regulator [Paenibacillus albiflavus]|uniref:LysR family transcriptional regulator n=1 Tax=Paenibacillus albiflavus TaxID=2545760 RepID=A0A4R4EHL4_9BACL|nr:LysR family transcriptional regulator [Paenibacillus albiflavus]TCZ78833.1 LysR family transcriptional regulator [Paenibacillus albiflavus]